MEFDWRGAIDRNCEILCDIAFRLIVMAGIEAGRTAATLPRHLYLRILAILRPAEFATRRLIAMAACKLPLDVGPLRRGRPANPSSPLGGEDTKACERSELAAVGEGVLAPPFPSPDLPNRSASLRGANRPLPEGARTARPLSARPCEI